MCPSGSSVLRAIEPPSKSGLRSAFEVLDVDKDGRISKEDLKSFYAGNGVSRDDALLGSMMTFADSNNDGYVEYNEFARAVGRRSAAGSNARRGGSIVEDLFNMMDCDGDGKLNRNDLNRFVRLAGIEAGDDDVSAMMSLAGEDHDGGVTIEEFVKVLSLGNFYY